MIFFALSIVPTASSHSYIRLEYVLRGAQSVFFLPRRKYFSPPFISFSPFFASCAGARLKKQTKHNSFFISCQEIFSHIYSSYTVYSVLAPPTLSLTGFMWHRGTFLKRAFVVMKCFFGAFPSLAKTLKNVS